MIQRVGWHGGVAGVAGVDQREPPAVMACIFIVISSLFCYRVSSGEIDDESETEDTGATTAPVPSLTVTESLIAHEILRLGGDWESDPQPRLVSFLGDKFKSEHYEMLTHLPTLTVFTVHEGVVDNFSLSCLSRVTELEYMEIRYSQVTAESFSLLRNNRSLQRLSFIDTSLPAGAVAQIATLTQIKELHFDEVEFDENIVESLSSMQNLKQLSFMYCDGVEREEVAAIEAALPNLD